MSTATYYRCNSITHALEILEEQGLRPETAYTTEPRLFIYFMESASQEVAHLCPDLEWLCVMRRADNTPESEKITVWERERTTP